MSARKGYFDKDCLYSTFLNTTGQTRTFGFLPPHGVALAPNEEYSVFGDAWEAVRRNPEHSSDRRQHQALATAIDRGDIEIISTPSQILHDVGNGNVKILKLNNGTLSTQAPCWDTSDASESSVAA